MKKKPQRLSDLEKHGRKTLAQFEAEEKSRWDAETREIVKAIADREGALFSELMDCLHGRNGLKCRFVLPDHAPIDFWPCNSTARGRKSLKLKKGMLVGDYFWHVWTGTCSYYKNARDLGEALTIASRAFEKNPEEFLHYFEERVTNAE